MNKAELIDHIAEHAGITKAQAGTAMDAFTSGIVGALQAGDSVTLVGFGTFSVSDRAERDGRNPQTGETIKIKARRVAKFKPGKSFAEEIDGAKQAPAKKK